MLRFMIIARPVCSLVDADQTYCLRWCCAKRPHDLV